MKTKTPFLLRARTLANFTHPAWRADLHAALAYEKAKRRPRRLKVMQIELCIGEMQRRLDLLGTVDVMLTFRRPVDAGRAEQLVRAAWDLTWLNPGLASGAQIDSGTALARVAAGSGSYYVYSVSGHLWIGDMAEANTEAAAA